MSHIKISSPFFSKLTHEEGTIGTTIEDILPAVNPGEKRILLIIQNKGSTDVITAILNSDPTVTSGIAIQPNQLISLDNYNGPLRCKSSGASSILHVAFANV
jgi:hypothetical protein